jgi:DNA-binding beta-propeller fold protein YncE
MIPAYHLVIVPRRVLYGLTAAIVLLGVSSMLSRPGPRPDHTLTLVAAPDALALDPSGATAVVGSASAGTLSLLDLTRGRVLRTVRVGPPRTPAPLGLAIASAFHHLFVTVPGDVQTPNVVQMRDSRSGSLLRDIQVGDYPRALAVDARRGHVLIANAGDGTVSLIDAQSGALLRTTPVGLLPLALAVDERTARAFVIGPPEQVDPAVASTPSGLVAVLDTRSGALVQITPLGSGPDAVAVDERTGRVFVATSNAGTVTVVDAHDGTLLRTVRVDPTPSLVVTLQYALAVDEARDRVYLSTWGPFVPTPGGLTLRGNGTLCVLDARTGTVLRRIGVGVAPIAVAVEKGSGRVVVANAGGVVRAADDWLALGTQRLRTWLPWLGHIAARPPQVSRVPGSVSLLDTAGL